MAGPGNPIGWLNVNQGYVVPGPTVVTGTLVSASATIQLSGTVTCVEGAFVTAGTLGVPRFTNAAFSNSGSIVVNGTIGNSATQNVTIWNLPVAIGNEWSGTLASGGALASSTSGWRGTGIILGTDCEQSGAAVQAPLADVFFYAGGSVTPGTGVVISGWFERSIDGTNFESALGTPSTTVAAMPRAPDFIIPLDVAAFAANNIKAAIDVELPSGNFKTIIQNNAGTVLPVGCAIIVAPKQLAQ